ncbi:MAG: deoxyribose-phosphate aldolase [Lachnospiraceae bacterium]|nr:deoxyribose-phosphate aldolase [Lachnospiraceae bacterium]
MKTNTLNNEQLLAKVDHTLLKPDSTWKQIQILCEDALAFNTASVCIPPCYIKRIREHYGDALTICTVIGFPLGYSVTESKVCETKQAVKDGADEIDMVINICDVKNRDYEKVFSEIKAVREACKDKILKVIVETCYLDEGEKIKLCQLVTDSGADYIKTSTGFGSNGATHSDIKLFKENIGSNIKIKAAGGITTLEDMKKYINEGCDRIGTSRAVSILKENTYKNL